MKKFVVALIVMVLGAGIVLACSVPFGPVVVAKQAFLGETSGISTTTIYTPSADGDFLVSVSGEASSTGAGVIDQVAWTGNRGSYTWQTYINSTNNCCGTFYSQAIHVVAGQAITFTTLEASSMYPSDYDVTVIVIQQ